MDKHKHIGIILAVSTLIVLFTTNGLLFKFDIINTIGFSGINLCINYLPYYINFILLLLIAIVYLSFQYFREKLILFVISSFVLQNLLMSAIYDLLHESVDYDISNDISFLVVIPVAIIGMIIWGIIYDSIRNRDTIKDIIKKTIIVLITLPIVLFIFLSILVST